MKDYLFDNNTIYVCCEGCEIKNIPTGKVGSISYWKKMLIETLETSGLEEDKEYLKKIINYSNEKILNVIEDHFSIGLAVCPTEKYIKANIYPKYKKNFLNVHRIKID